MGTDDNPGTDNKNALPKPESGAVGAPGVAAPAPAAKPAAAERGWFWGLMNQDPPAAKKENRENFFKAVQKLLVAGTMGALFTAVVRNVPITWHQIGQPVDWNYTADLFMRYAYLIWLLLYFLTSNTGFDLEGYTRVEGDFTYDLGQSVGTLIAAVYLGFVFSNFRQHHLGAYFVTNAVICVICFVAHWWFKGQAPSTPGVRRMRLLGGWVSLAGALFAVAMRGCFGSEVSTWVYGVFAGLWILLVFALGSFIRIRLDVGSRNST